MRRPVRVVLEPVGMARPSVLLLDDDEDSLLILEEALRAYGFDVRATATCAEARATLAHDHFDVLVTDMCLDDGDGIGLLRSLGDHRPKAAVLVTGFGAAEDRIASRAAGFQAHLVKPVALDQLDRTLRAVLAAIAA